MLLYFKHTSDFLFNQVKKYGQLETILVCRTLKTIVSKATIMLYDK